MAAVLTIDDLLRVLAECAGETAGADPSGDDAHRTFEEMGYDSLVLLETNARLKQDFGIDIPDEADGAKTPADLLTLANATTVGVA
ncbi:acyl carrier protein [Streptomyces platensis]|uniref:acyl carrier protein n=1 Tax=Streptomyces platensis TaxID=58346 RepID=UPI0033198181